MTEMYRRVEKKKRRLFYIRSVPYRVLVFNKKKCEYEIVPAEL